MKFEDVYILDENAKWIGLDTKVLMENAGRGVANEVLDLLNREGKSNDDNNFALFCGSGNNGGDGFVVARHLSSYGSVDVYLFGDKSSMSNITKDNYKVLKSIPSVEIIKIKDSNNLHDISFNYDVLLDALLGVGIIGKPREPMETAINLINQSKSTIVSIDVPTGLGTNVKVDSDLVITFHEKKDRLKDPKVVNIGIPKDLNYFAGPGDVKSLRERGSKTHKGQNGKMLVIGGSKSYHGAPILASEAASNLVDLVYLASNEKVISKASENIIPIEFQDEILTKNDVEKLEKTISERDIDSVLLGPGLDSKEKSLRAAENLIKNIKVPIIVDADGLKIKNLKERLRKEDIITPHKEELNNLLKRKIELPEAIKGRGNQIKKIANDLEVNLALKGAIDFISNGERWKYNETGNEGMTTGGTGDVLAGIIAGFRTNNSAFKSATSGTFLNGYIGDQLYKKYRNSYTAKDMIQILPETYNKVLNL